MTHTFAGGRALLVLAGIALTAGCTIQAVPTSTEDQPVSVDASTAPSVPSTGFTLSRTGGVAGVQDVLRVDPDGTAVYVGHEVAVGMLSSGTMHTLDGVLTSADLWAEGDFPVIGGQMCNDVFTLTLQMGDLTVSREDCGDDREMPLFRSVLELLGPAMSGEFESPLPATPALQAVTLTRTGHEYNNDGAVAIAADGSAVVTTETPVDIAVVPSPEQLDAVRLLSARVDPASPGPDDCTTAGSYELTIGAQPPVTLNACAGTPSADVDLRGLVVVLSALMDSVID